MTVLDLQHLDQAEKQEDLVRIFSAAQDLLLGRFPFLRSSFVPNQNSFLRAIHL